MLADVIDLLRCPVCGAAAALDGAVVRCDSGHAFDVARQGHVTLVPGRGDAAQMVAARDRVLGAGLLAPLTAALAEEVAAVPPGPVLDVGAGTGHHLAAVLGDDRAGVALDTSPAALRRAARAHPRIGAIGADSWRPLPLRDAAFAAVLCVFAPRDGAELARVLAPGGAVIVATPRPEHLGALVSGLGLLTVPADKDERLDARLAPHLRLDARRDVTFELALDRAQAVDLAAMGPSGFHVDAAELERRAAALPEPLAVTAAVAVSRFVHGG